MNKILIRFSFPLLLVLLLLTKGLLAQNKESDKEDMVKAQKIAFFTEKLNLSPEEAQKFWPVYNDYWKRKNKIIEDRRSLMKECNDKMSKLSAREIEHYGDLYIKSHKLEADLLEEFNLKFKKVLPVEKVMKLYFADHEFKTYLLQQIRNSSKKEE
jgi:hypothetical protein